MENPFPGIDPWMEHHWDDAHVTMVVHARRLLRPQLPSHLRLRIEERSLTDPATGEDVMYGRHLVVRRQRVEWPPITMIELLAPWDKEPGEERDAYLAFRERSIRAGIHHVEIDLLRSGQRTHPIPLADMPEAARTVASRILVVRASAPYQAEVYPVPLRTRLPNIRIPLGDDPDVVLELQPLLDEAYVSGSYGDTDYARPPVPELGPDDAAWAHSILTAKGLLNR